MESQELVNAIRHINSEAEFSFTGVDLDTIVWDKPKTGYPTKDEIFAAVEASKAKAQTDLEQAAIDKAALLAKLGITADEAKLLLS